MSASDTTAMGYFDPDRRFSKFYGENFNYGANIVLQQDSTPKACYPRAVGGFDGTGSLQPRSQTPTIRLNDYRIPMNPQSVKSHSDSYFCVDGFSRNVCSSDAPWPEEKSELHDDVSTCTSRSGNRGRTTYSDEQINALEKAFSCNPYPNPQSRQHLARNINVPEGKVKIWFQNRRARAKKQKVPSNTWKCGGKGGQRAEGSHIETDAVEEGLGGKNNGKEELVANNHSSLSQQTPISFSSLTLSSNACSSTMPLSTYSQNTHGFAQSLTASNKNSTWYPQNNWSSFQENVGRRNNENFHSLNYHPPRFPVIKQRSFNFAQYNASVHDFPFPAVGGRHVHQVSSFPNYSLLNEKTRQTIDARDLQHGYHYKRNCNEIFDQPNANHSSEMSSLSSVSVPFNLSSSGSFSPPPLRRYLLPFNKLKNPVKNKRASSKIAKKSFAKENDEKLSADDEKITVAKSSNHSYQADTERFYLHGMDYRHKQAYGKSQCEEPWLNQVNGVKPSNAARTTTIYSCDKNPSLEKCNNEANIPPPPIDLQRFVEDPSDFEWLHHNVDFTNVLDSAEQSGPSPSSDSFESICPRALPQNEQATGWKHNAGASSASVVG